MSAIAVPASSLGMCACSCVAHIVPLAMRQKKASIRVNAVAMPTTFGVSGERLQT